MYLRGVGAAVGVSEGTSPTRKTFTKEVMVELARKGYGGCFRDVSGMFQG